MFMKFIGKNYMVFLLFWVSWVEQSWNLGYKGENIIGMMAICED